MLIKIFTFLRQYDSINIFRIIYIFAIVRRAGMGRVVIGVDLGGTNLRTALLSPDGDILAKHKEPTYASEGWKNVVTRLIDGIKEQQESAGERGLAVTAVGVGVPGVIQSDRGIVVKSPNFPDWNNLPIKDSLEKALNLPVTVENDANAAALGEQWRGVGCGIKSMILLTLGTGVGGGIILNNQIWQGADGMAGELGHMTIIPDGRRCGCGNTGCLEMYASARGIVESYRERKTPAMPSCGESTSEQACEVPASRTESVPSRLGDDAGMVGAAAAALQNMEKKEKK